MEIDPREKLERGENMGVIVEVRPTDWIRGIESGLAYEERNSTGDWEKYKPSDEIQKQTVSPSGKLRFDSNSCTNFSCMNSVEMQINWLVKSGRMPSATMKRLEQLGYLDENGMVNLSDWFNALTSGTTPNGNNLQNPWDALRKYGAIPQSMGYVPNDFATIEEWFSWSRITKEMLDMGKEFLKLFKIEYEWVITDDQGEWELLAKELKHAPLHLASPTCSSWNTAPPKIVKDCGTYKRLNHATCYIGQSKGKYHKDLDHYKPFVKHLDWDYWITHAIKGVITPLAYVKPEPFKYTFNRNLAFGDPESTEVRMMQTALQKLTSSRTGKPYMQPGVFGMFHNLTKAALGQFQTEEGIPDPDGQGMNFGPKTRAAMNRRIARL